MGKKNDSKSEIDVLSKDKQNNKIRGNWKEVATICNYLGELLRNEARYEDAISEHETELEMCQKVKDRMGIAIANRKIGECYCDMEDFEKAERFQRRYLDIARELNSDIEQQRAYATLGRTYLCQAEATGDLRQYLSNALESFNLSLDFALLLKDEMTHKDAKEYSLMVGRLYLNLGICFELSGNFLKAMKYLQDARAQLTVAKNDEEEVRCLVALGSISQKMGNFDPAQDFAKSAYQFAKRGKDGAVLDETLLLRAALAFETQAFLESRHCLKKIMHSKISTDENKLKAKRMLGGLRKVQSALNHVKCSTDNRKDMKNLESIADEYCANDCFYSGMRYYKQVLELAEENGSPKPEMAAVCVSLAQTSSDLKNFTDAIRYSRSELVLRDDPEQRCRTWLNIADYSHKSNQNDAATLSCYENAVKEAKKSGKHKLVIRCMRDQCEMFSAINEDREKISNLQQEIRELESVVDLGTESEEEEDERIDRSPTPMSEELSSATDSEGETSEEVGLGKSRARGGYKIRKNEKGETLLHTAVIQGNFKRVKQLIAQGHPVNERDNCGWLPIHEAANHNHLEIATFLIEHNALLNDPGLKDCRGLTPILDAAYAGNLDMVRLLLDRGAHIKCRDNDRRSVIDALLTWRKENFTDVQEVMDDQTEQALETLVADLQAAMIQAGVKPEELRARVQKPPRTAEKQVDTSQHNRKRSPSPSLEENAAMAYRDAIENMKGNRRRQEKRRRAPTPDALEPVRDTGPLIPANEFVGDDWLIEDAVSDNPSRMSRTAADLFYTSGMRQSSGAKRKAPSVSAGNIQLNARKKSTGSAETSSTNHDRTSASPERPSRSGVDTSLSRTTMDFPTSPPVAAVAFASSPAAPATVPPSHSDLPEVPPGVAATAPPVVHPITHPIRRVRVRILDTVILIPLATSQDRTIAWLKDEAANRYAEMKGQKPVLHLKTLDGAMLSALDQVRDVVGEAEELIGDVISWSILSVSERYSKACQAFNTPVISSLTQVLMTACETGIVYASELNLCSRRISCIFRALNLQTNIKQLSLEGNPMADSGFSSLIDIFPSIPNLTILNVTCTDISITSLEALKTVLVTSTSKPLQCLSELHMGHNDFSDDGLPLVGNILMELPCLTSLTLDNCGFTPNCLDDRELIMGTALARSSRLRKLSLAFNRLQSKGVAKLLSILPENVKTVNVSCSMTDIHSLPQRFLASSSKIPEHLQEIFLAHCGVTSENFADVLDCLSTFRSLRKVNLAHNVLLSSNDVELMLGIVKKRRVSWTDVDIRGNLSAALILPFLMNVLEDCPGLKKISLTLRDPTDRATLSQFWKRLRGGSALIDELSSTISLSEF